MGWTPIKHFSLHRWRRETWAAPYAELLFAVGSCFLPLAGLVGAPGTARADDPKPDAKPDPKAWVKFPQQDPAAVRDFVGACHRNIDYVKSALAEHPALATCAWDWGYGDWESGLGAAAHTGRKEIAKLLLEHGARLDIFAATMLGMVDAVKAMVAAQPGIEATPGPHGIMLLAHAEAGEDAPMVDYIKTLPKATRATPAVLGEAECAPYLGDYRGDGGLSVTVSRNRFGLAVKATAPNAGGDVRLVPVSANQFHPAGAPNVRITFTMDGGGGGGGAAKRVEFVEAGWFAGATRS